MFKDLQVMEMPKRKKAAGFVKSRKSHEKIHQFCHEMYHYGLANGICIKECIVDESAGIDIDRESIDKLMYALEQDDYKCVVVPAISDFTKDTDDLLQFLMHLKDMGCQVYSIEEEGFIEGTYGRWDQKDNR